MTLRRIVTRFDMIAAYDTDKGPVDTLRRNIKMRRSPLTYVYENAYAKTGALVLSNFPLEREDLVGVYRGKGLTNAQLRADIFG